MANATITGTASNFGSISGVLAGEAGTVAGTITGTVSGTLTGSVGVPGAGVPSGGTTGQVLKKVSNTDYDTTWGTDIAATWGSISGTITNQTDLTAYVAAQLAGGTAVAKNLEVYVRNQSGATLTAGTIVYIDGATGNRPTVTKAQANNDANSAQTFGFIKENIANNGFGYVIVRGELENVDTSALTEGQQLYLSPTTAGTWTTTKPSAPQHLVYVGIVVRAHPTQGIILVAIQNGYELNELHDVKITSVSNGQVLKYDSAQGLWVNGTDSSGVAWGGITGTLSAQTDLQTALDGKYAKSGGALNSGVDLTIDYPAGGSNVQLNGQNIVFRNNTTTNIYGALLNNQLIINEPGVGYTQITATGVTFPDTTFQSTAFIPANYLSKAGNLSGLADTSAARSNLGLGTMATETASNYLTTSAASSTYLTQANAASTYQTQAGMSSYLTTSAAASTYQTISGMSSYLTTSAASSTYAPLASPALTGTPTAPTAAVDTNTTQVATTAYVVGQGYLKSATASSTYAPLASPALTGTPTAPTASAGTNTTQIATTAFVQQEVPSASTTAAGKVELATNAEAIATTSTTLVPAIATLPAILAKPELRSLAHISLTAIANSGGVSSSLVGWGVREMYLGSLAIGRAAFLYSNYATQSNLWSRADRTKLDFSKKIWMAGKCCLGFVAGATSYLGDANTMTRITLGGYTTNTTGDMTQKGIGFKKVGGTSSAISLTVHNGTTLTDVATTKTCADGEVIDWVVYSDGTGNVTLFINGTQEATTSAGPTGTTTAGYNTYREQVEATSTPGVRGIIQATGGWIYVEG